MKYGSDHDAVRHVLTRRGFVGALGVLSLGVRAVAQGQSPVLESEQVSQLPGRHVARGSPDYENWRQSMTWQMYTAPRYPDIIVRPDKAAEVPDVVTHARKDGLKLAIKSGGHNVSAAFLRDGGMLLDLGELQAIDVDPRDRSAWVEPALWSHGLLQGIQSHGLAFPIAHCATVPMGGYLLGGGLGNNHDNWGTLACDSVLAAELVLASGETIVASPDQHADLYWAIRGSGTGFPGIVTRYKLKLYTAPETVLESSYIFPLTQLEAATGMLQDWHRMKPKDTELMMLLAHSPMADSDAPPLEQKICIVRAVVYSASRSEARASLERLAAHPLTGDAAMKNEHVPTSLEQMQVQSVDTRMGLGFGRYAVDTVWTNRLPDVMAAVRDHFASAHSAKTHFVVSPKMNKALNNKAAASMIGDTFVGAYTMWDEAENDADNMRWLAGASQRMRPLAVGQYINEVDAFRDPSVLRRCFSADAWQRITRLRQKYDPLGVFANWPGIG